MGVKGGGEEEELSLIFPLETVRPRKNSEITQLWGGGGRMGGGGGYMCTLYLFNI